jgi:hypothetical protein
MVKAKLTWHRRFGEPLRRLDKDVKLIQIKWLLLALQKYATPFRRSIEMTQYQHSGPGGPHEESRNCESHR